MTANRTLLWFALAFLNTLLFSCSGGKGEGSNHDGTDSTDIQYLRSQNPDTAFGQTDLYPKNESGLKLKELTDLVAKHMEMKNYAYARHYLDIAIERDSNHEVVLDQDAGLNLITNRSRNANRLWEKCVKLYPKEINCRVHLAQLKLSLGLNSDALKLANEIIGINPQKAEGYFIKGMCIRALKGDTTGSIPYFQKAVDLKSDYIEALDMLGYIFAQRKDTLALAYYRRILGIDPKRGDVYFKMGVFHMERREWNKAMAAYENAITRNPQDADSHFNLGFIYIELEEFSKARLQFSKAVGSSQRNYKAHYGRAYAAERLGDLQNAATDYREALSINPKHQPSAEGLNRVKEKLNLKPN